MPAGFTRDEAGILIDALARARLARDDGRPFASFRDAVDDAGAHLSFVGRDAPVARVEAMGPEERRAVMGACAWAISLRLAMPDRYRRDGEGWLRREAGPARGWGPPPHVDSPPQPVVAGDVDPLMGGDDPASAAHPKDRANPTIVPSETGRSSGRRPPRPG